MLKDDGWGGCKIVLGRTVGQAGVGLTILSPKLFHIIFNSFLYIMDYQIIVRTKQALSTGSKLVYNNFTLNKIICKFNISTYIVLFHKFTLSLLGF